MLTLLFLAWKLLPWFLLLIAITRLLLWAYFTFASPATAADLSAFGAQSKRAWCLITGATDGIGLGLSQELAKLKFNLFLVGRNEEKLAAVKRDILNSSKRGREGTKYFTIHPCVDPQVKIVTIVSEASDATLQNVKGVIETVKATLEAEKGTLRMLINNVGIGWGRKCRFGDIGADEIERIEEIVAVNCSYPVLLTRATLKLLRARAQDYAKGDKVAILNLASCAALTPSTPFSALYAATKAFNRSFSNSLAGEVVARRLLHPERPIPDIQVLCVNPGFVVSNMTGMKESLLCCSARSHAQVILRKLTFPFSMDIVPHWKHGLMWAVVAAFEWIIPIEWVLVGLVMPAILKFSGKFRNFKID